MTEAELETHAHLNTFLALLHASLKKWEKFTDAYKSYDKNSFRNYITLNTIKTIMDTDRINQNNLPEVIRASEFTYKTETLEFMEQRSGNPITNQISEIELWVRVRRMCGVENHIIRS